MPRQRTGNSLNKIAWDGLPVRRSCRLLAQYTPSSSNSQCPPQSPTPPVPSQILFDYPTPLFVPSSPEEGEENFFPEDVDIIGNVNPEFIDGQENEVGGRASNCEELEEEDFDEGPYSSYEIRNLDDLLWPPELLYNPGQIARPPKRSRNASTSTRVEREIIHQELPNEGSPVHEPVASADTVTRVPLPTWESSDGDEGDHCGYTETARERPRGRGWEHGQERLQRQHSNSPSIGNESGSELDIEYPEFDFGEEEENDICDDGYDGDVNSMKYVYRDSTWHQNFITYAPEPEEYLGCYGSTFSENRFPTFSDLFQLFWPLWILRDIVAETNRYATALNTDGGTYGGPNWKNLTILELKVFMAIILYMGMRQQPNLKSFWHKKGLFHCPTISNLMSRSRFELLTKCLHVTNPATYESDKRMPGYDKMGQVRWLLNAVRNNYQNAWNVGKFATIDEMMIRYKGTYCPARQYMPQKPQKWGLKVWCLADSKSKFVSNFEVYCGKNPVVEEEMRRLGGHGEVRLAQNVVLRLLVPIEGKRHVIVMDNFFSSVALFKDLLDKKTYATGTMRANRVGLPQCFKNTKDFNRNEQGTLDWRMHDSRQMSSIIWKDKKVVLIISTHAVPIQFPWEFPVTTVPRRNGSERENIQTSPVHLEYTTHMRGVDVADQLRASYSCQTRSHKCWHRVFFFLVDTSIVNMYIIYMDKCKAEDPPRRPMKHLQFRTQLCETLTARWQRKRRQEFEEPPCRRQVCYPAFTTDRNPCVVCNNGSSPLTRPKTYCPTCGNKFMCWRKGCFQIFHERFNG